MGQAQALGRRVRTTSLATLQTYESSVLEATKEALLSRVSKRPKKMNKE